MPFTKSLRNKVAKASDNGPSLGTWLERIRAIDNPILTEAIEGIWCGRSGETRLQAGDKNLLCVGWYNGRVEWSYLS